MKKLYLLIAAMFLAIGLQAQTLGQQSTALPKGFDPTNIAHPVSASTLQQVAKKGQRTTPKLTNRRNMPKIAEETVDTVDYFAAGQSYYSNYAFNYDGGAVKTYKLGVAVNGDQVTFKNLFNLYDPTSYYPNVEVPVTGTYNATDKTITIPASTNFDQATVVASLMGYYVGTLVAGTVNEDGTLTPADNLVLHVDGDFDRIYLDGQAAGVAMWTPDGSTNYGISGSSEMWRALSIQKPGTSSGVILLSDQVHFGETYAQVPQSKTVTLVNTGDADADYAIDIDSDPENAFTVDAASGTIPAFGKEDVTFTFSTPVVGDAEGLANISTEDKELSLQLYGTIMPPPDYSPIVKNGDFEFATDLTYPFVLDTLSNGTVTARSSALSWYGTSSKMDVTFTVPEGKLGRFSFNGNIINEAGSYNYAAGYFSDDLTTPVASYNDAAKDISNTLEFAPGKHTVRFQFDCYSRVTDPDAAQDSRIYIYNLDLENGDMAADSAAITDSVANVRYAIIPKGGTASKSDDIAILNRGANDLSLISVTSDNPEFTANTKVEPVGTMKTLQIPVVLSATTPGKKTANLTIVTSAGTFNATAKADVIEEQDFSKVVSEGYEYFTVVNDPDHPFIVEGDSAYNLNSDDPDDETCLSNVAFSFTIPQGKMGVLSWDGFNYTAPDFSDYGQIEISHPMGGGTHGIWESGDAGSTIFASDDAWADYLNCVPGDHTIYFEYVRNGDGLKAGKSRLSFKNLKLRVFDFDDYAAEPDSDNINFKPCYVGPYRWSQATLNFTNLGSQDLKVDTIIGKGPFSGNVPTETAAYGKKLPVTLFFYPQEAGEFTDTITVCTNAGDFDIVCHGSTLDNTGIVYNGDLEDQCYGWQFIDADGDGNNWSTAYWLFGGGMTEEGYSRYCHSGSNLIGSASSSAYGDALTPDNWAISPAITIPADGATLSYYVASLNPDRCNEYYTVYVSESDDYNEIEQSGEKLWDGYYELPQDYDFIPWVNKQYSLDKYAGKTIHLAFRHHNCSGQYLLILDDIFVYNKGFDPTGINSVKNTTGNEGASYYTIGGVRLNAPAQGVNIIRKADGTTQKVLVK